MLYIAILVLLYIVTMVLPSVTDRFESTEVLEPGTLEFSCETTGYMFKDEYVGLAPKSGKLKYKVKEGAAVKKGHKVASINSKKAGKSSVAKKYKDYLEAYKGSGRVKRTTHAQASGVFSKTIDGYERLMRTARVKKITKAEIEDYDFKPIELKREKAAKGEPIFKISNDNKYIIVCWMDKETAKDYEEGLKVKLQLPAGELAATVDSRTKENDEFKVAFYIKDYYADFSTAREMDMKVIIGNNTGLLVSNSCIIEKNGEKGVYVKNKNNDIYFVPVYIKASNDKQSVLADTTYINDKGEQVLTVNVYDEVLKSPQQALEDDLAAEELEKQNKNNDSETQED